MAKFGSYHDIIRKPSRKHNPVKKRLRPVAVYEKKNRQVEFVMGVNLKFGKTRLWEFAVAVIPDMSI